MLRMGWLLAMVSLAGCSVELVHGLDERQANEIFALLETEGIDADKLADDAQGGGYKILIPRGHTAEAFALLGAHDLPRANSKGLADSFAGGGLLPSSTEERARYGAALSAELERTLEAVPGVLTARVHIALPAADGLVVDAKEQVTASVLLKISSPLAIQEAAVKRLVSGAVPALLPEAVHVVVAPAAPAHQASQRAASAIPRSVFPPSVVAALAAASLLLIIVLGSLLTWTSLRLYALRRELPADERAA